MLRIRCVNKTTKKFEGFVGNGARTAEFPNQDEAERKICWLRLNDPRRENTLYLIEEIK
jgi:hypothetical protein